LFGLVVVVVIAVAIVMTVYMTQSSEGFKLPPLTDWLFASAGLRNIQDKSEWRLVGWR
jgi:hypothetical protein